MLVPEYRRFIAYFYEYIDGKKQKNAGFAKVELRNGMWRILFRLITEVLPEPPMQVYGFVRTEGYLLGVPMGTIRSGREIAEEWAYQAEAPIGKTEYRLEDLAGIRIVSGDERFFLTVWDDEPVKPEQFVLELPQENALDLEVPQEPHEKLVAESEIAAGDVKMSREEKTSELADVVREEKIPEVAGAVREEETSQAADAVREERIPEVADVVREEETPEAADAVRDEETSEAADSAGTVKASENTDYADSMRMAEESQPAAVEKAEAAAVEKAGAAAMEMEAASKPKLPQERLQQEAEMSGKPQPRDGIKDLFRIRSHFQPFDDTELTNCVMIMPCDIIRLQQEHWQVGRSSFLQHGFYQHRHLLLGMTGDSEYVVGVPGVRNPQEQYMAEMFGFGRFKVSKTCECGKVFGYWCRTLQQMP